MKDKGKTVSVKRAEPKLVGPWLSELEYIYIVARDADDTWLISYLDTEVEARRWATRLSLTWGRGRPYQVIRT